jgi:sulfonate transport system substrate-binding protein
MAPDRSARIQTTLAALFVVVLALVGGMWMFSGKGNPSAATHEVTIGIQVSPAMALAMVASDEGYFEDEGLHVKLVPFTAGKFAMQTFLAGSIDFAISGEVPACLAALQGNQFRVVTQVVQTTTNEVRVVALKDDDLRDPQKYFTAKKRKLSTSFGGGPEFFTYNFLKFYGIRNDQVEIISQKPEDMPVALKSRSVDAIAIFDPFAYIAEKRLGIDAQTFADPRLYSELYVLAARPEQIDQQKAVITGLLRALVRAGDFIQKNPDQAKQSVENHTKLDREVVDGIWHNFVFKPALTAQLIDDWTAEAKWAQQMKMVPPDAKLPNFRNLIDDSFLRPVDPSAVQLP